MKPVDATLEDYQSMLVLFEDESDRGAAVLAGSYVENHLGLFLKSKMIDPSVAERMFSSNGSLSTFCQRIDFAQAFGLLSKVQCEDLHIIRKIRNHFAHHPKDSSFSEKPVSDWVENLISSKTKIPMPDGSTSNVGDGRFCYLISAGMFIALTMDAK